MELLAAGGNGPGVEGERLIGAEVDSCGCLTNPTSSGAVLGGGAEATVLSDTGRSAP